MAEKNTSALRIFCLCGQKMKVLPDMYGRPGKCIACRQKIRIPRKDEIPPGTTEIHIKDHPELLRKPSQPDSSHDADQDVVALGSDTDGDSAVALDVLEPLRILCSLEHTISGQEEPSKTVTDRVRQARADLDQALRQHLRKSKDELDKTREELVQLLLASRTGERDFLGCQARLAELRERRDRLERRVHNLRGWLACDDPYMAGGYNVNLSANDIPDIGFHIPFPPEPQWMGTSADAHMRSYQGALLRRAEIARKVREAGELVAGDSTGVAALEPQYAAYASEQHRTNAEVAFIRKCLDRARRDCARDKEAIDAQLERAALRLQSAGPAHRARWKSVANDLRNAAAIVEAEDRRLARALEAEYPEDVPTEHGLLDPGGLGSKALKGLIAAACVLVAAAAIAAVVLIRLNTDPGQPYVSVSSSLSMEGAAPTYEARITVGNPGKRSFRLRRSSAEEEDACRYYIERRMRTGVWGAVGIPYQTVVDGQISNDAGTEIEIRAEGQAELLYRLQPGLYRVRLAPQWRGGDEVAEEFVLEPPPDTAPAVVEETASVGSPSEAPAPRREASEAGEAVVELRGFAMATGREPHFAFSLTMSDGVVLQRDLRLHAELHDGWRVAEYNRENQTVTLVRGGRPFILRRGEPLPLPERDAQP